MGKRVRCLDGRMKMREIGEVKNRLLHFPIPESGIWGDAIRERKAIVINDYSSPHYSKKGTPEGHLPLTRLVSIPIFEGDKIVMLAAVANKKIDYDDSDIHQLTLLFDGMWKFINKRRIEETLRKNKQQLQAIMDNSRAVIYVKDKEGRYLMANKHLS